jgi:hypothetical protein
MGEKIFLAGHIRLRGLGRVDRPWLASAGIFSRQRLSL